MNASASPAGETVEILRRELAASREQEFKKESEIRALNKDREKWRFAAVAAGLLLLLAMLTQGGRKFPKPI